MKANKTILCTVTLCAGLFSSSLQASPDTVNTVVVSGVRSKQVDLLLSRLGDFSSVPREVREPSNLPSDLLTALRHLRLSRDRVGSELLHDPIQEAFELVEQNAALSVELLQTWDEISPDFRLVEIFRNKGLQNLRVGQAIAYFGLAASYPAELSVHEMQQLCERCSALFPESSSTFEILLGQSYSAQRMSARLNSSSDKVGLLISLASLEVSERSHHGVSDPFSWNRPVCSWARRELAKVALKQPRVTIDRLLERFGRSVLGPEGIAHELVGMLPTESGQECLSQASRLR